MTMHTEPFDTITAQALDALLRSETLFALFDARDEGLFARRHMLFACSLPLSDIEVRVRRLMPRDDRLIVMTSDEQDGMALRAAMACAAAGYRNVRLLQGGNEAWERAGHRLFSGIHVPSKAFGELVESHYHTPMIEPAALHDLQARGANIAVFDSRPPHEFQRMSLPGASNCPGADLVARVPALVRDPDTLVVVNCAGRTRSIIGAQSLINAGVANRVVALKNGTMGWHLAGFELDHGRQALVPGPVPGDEAALDGARLMAARLRERFGIGVIGAPDLKRMLDEGGSTDALLLDVRGPWEYEAGHLPGARNAPGGQLVQATDLYVAVRHTPLVLVDDDGIRASVTASWLVQMGLRQVLVLDHADAARLFTETGAFAAVAPHRVPDVPSTTVHALVDDLEARRTTVIDVSRSDSFYKGHIPGARFAIRSRFAHSLPTLDRFEHLVLLADDDVVARFAAAEARTIYGAPVRVLAGGMAAWRAAMLPVADGLDGALDPPEDMWHIPSSPLGGREAAMKNYISWEIDLAAQVANEPGASFRVGDPSRQAADRVGLDPRHPKIKPWTRP